MAEEEAKEVARWGPFRELASLEPFGLGLSPRISQLFRDFVGEDRRLAAVLPPLDVTEADDEYVVTVEVPGVKRGDLTVECADGLLHLRGEKKSEREESKEKARLLERSYGAFSRSIRLPADANPDRIKASFRDGVLKIEIERTLEAKPRVISIKG